MKSSLRTKLAELQAHKPTRPKWMPAKKPCQVNNGFEMISLSEGSDFAKIPAELQLHILSYLDYQEVVGFKQTCRYFNYFINEDVMRESKASHIAWYHELERTRTLPPSTLPCYTCLKLKPDSEFYNTTGNYYYNAPPYGVAVNQTPGLPPQDFEDRFCIQCGFNDCKFNLGVRLNTNGRSLMYCAGCGKLDDQPLASYTYYDTCCEPCKKEFEFLRINGVAIRLGQWILSIIILSLACTGQAMPWTSHANEHSLRWVFTIVVCFFTVAGTLVSTLARMQVTDYSLFKTRRSENGRFVFLVEFSSLLAWMGVCASLFNEGAHRHFTDRFDRFAKVLTAMVFLECFLFLISTLWANSRILSRIVHGKNGP